ncbi:hypothetical protein BU14_2708s0001 [Porphyra umbilicalis]|uniref:Uncharacterized protein n=1 Tax=Porphyra umbilicalis TaxID=2786 RepID=A0A1X6NIP8_PORUM|nr:hypothetical protein BU14_2708s0001 [Porphyra umbilicalis]|eukprot:OSX68489.1 hypothetical protein BU14_2708s0001 [Porphyra umbilicalis]
MAAARRGSPSVRLVDLEHEPECTLKSISFNSTPHVLRTCRRACICHLQALPTPRTKGFRSPQDTSEREAQ